MNHTRGIGGGSGGDRTLVRLGPVRRWPTAAPLLLGVVLVSGIAVLDWVTGPDVSVDLLYVVAVVAVTWCGTSRHGALVAALAAVDGLAAHSAAASWSTGTAALWHAASRFLVLLAVTRLLAGLRAALVEQRHLATVDPLTGALNRRAFQVAAERERLRAARTGHPTSVAYLDLDGFKGVNDRLGHRAGDRLLAAFAAAVAGSIRATDLFARIGGDEFAVVLPETDAPDAVRVMERVRRAVADRCCGDGEWLTASTGVATYRYPPTGVDEMLGEADRIMYRAKAAGGDRVVGSVVSGPWLRWGGHSLRPDPESAHPRAG